MKFQTVDATWMAQMARRPPQHKILTTVHMRYALGSDRWLGTAQHREQAVHPRTATGIQTGINFSITQLQQGLAGFSGIESEVKQTTNRQAHPSIAPTSSSSSRHHEVNP